MHQTVDSLSTWIHRIQHWTVLTGAGVSAGSGIPTYRDRSGKWLRVDPIQHRDFLASEITRQRYWGRSLVGWPGVNTARPNAVHEALVHLDQAGKIDTLITQNVDRLHQRAGSRRVIDLHGRLDRVKCTSCAAIESREDLQLRLLDSNPFVHEYSHIARPDGDADVPDSVVERITIPACSICEGVLMPDVVFFGGTVPQKRVEACRAAIERSAGLLVVGSSLQVYSGYRFCRLAERLRIPIVIVNEGVTRADELATLKIESNGLQRLVASIDELFMNREISIA